MAQVGSCALMNEAELGQWILRRLGAPVWPVQICDDHVNDAIATAKRWFAAKKGVIGRYVIQAQTGTPDYDLADEVDVVLDVAFLQQRLDLTLVFSPFTLLEEKIPYDVFASGGSGGLYSSYVQTLQYIETAKRILSAELEWRQDRGVGYNKLFIAPNPVHAMTMVVDAKVSCFNLQAISERDHDLIKRYALAMAMKDLGFIRSTLSEYPGANGSVTMNGERLLEEANTQIEKLEEEIMGAGYPLGWVTG